MPELKGSKTEANLMTAFAGESQARNKYTYYASKAKKDGYVQIAALFEETANNEKEHAKIWFKLLHGGIGDTIDNLKDAAAGENYEWTDMYAGFAKTAREAELKKQEVEVAKQALDAEIRAKADADRYRKEQEAQAALFQRQKDAEAKRYEQEQEAEAVKKQAEAARFAKEQEAAGISAVGKAEAAAIQAKALAEAEGIDKKAEAMKKYGQAAVIEMVMNALPEIAKNVAQPLSKVDKITMYGEGNSAKLLQDIINGTTQVSEGIAQGMGIDIKALLSGMLGGKVAAEHQDGPAPARPRWKQLPRNLPRHVQTPEKQNKKRKGHRREPVSFFTALCGPLS